MKKTLVFLFIFPFVAFATSKISYPPNQRLSDHCVLSAKFLGPSGKKLAGGKGKTSNSENAVYWELEPVDSVGENCPNARALSLRVRSADFSNSISEPKFTYPMDIVEPKLNEQIRLKVRFIKGKDTFLNREISEWTFIERIND